MTAGTLLWEAIVNSALSLIQIAIWPSTVITLVLIFRSQIGQLLTSASTRRTRITVPGLTLDLAEVETLMDRFTPEIAELLEVMRRSPQALARGEEAPPGSIDEDPALATQGISTEKVDEAPYSGPDAPVEGVDQ